MAPLMRDLHVVMADTTRYESQLRFPTDEKLLWESTEWTHGRIVDLWGTLKTRCPRSKYDDVRKRSQSFIRTRNKTVKKKRRLRAPLFCLLGKTGNSITLMILHLRHMGDKYIKEPENKRKSHALSVIQFSRIWTLEVWVA